MFRDRVEPATGAAELLAQLAALTREITATPPNDPFEQLVAVIVSRAAHILRADRAAVWLEFDDAVAVIATTGLRATTVDRFRRFDVPSETRAKSTLRRGVPISWTTHASAQRYFPHISADDFGSGLVSPLHIGDRYTGVLFVGWAAEHRRLHETERSFLETIAHSCAIVVGRSNPIDDRDDASVEGIIAIGETFAIKVTKSVIETIAWISGEVDVSNLDQFAHSLQHITDNCRSDRLVLEFTDVDFLSVAAARLVLGMSAERTDRDTSLEVRNVSANIQRVFDIVSTN